VALGQKSSANFVVWAQYDLSDHWDHVGITYGCEADELRNALLFIPQALSPSFAGLLIARWFVSHVEYSMPAPSDVDIARYGLVSR
jgi:hypothetical protein